MSTHPLAADQPVPPPNAPSSGQEPPPLQPGEAELLLKLRGVEPKCFPPLHNDFPSSVGRAQLQHGMAAEMRSRRPRASYEAGFSPILGVAPTDLVSLAGGGHLGD